MIQLAERQDVKLKLIRDCVDRLREELRYGTIYATLEEIEYIEYEIEHYLESIKEETEDFLSA